MKLLPDEAGQTCTLETMSFTGPILNIYAEHLGELD